MGAASSILKDTKANRSISEDASLQSAID